MKNRILALILVTVMLFSFALPVSAQDIINLTDYGESEAPTQPEPTEDTSETTDATTEPTDPPAEDESESEADFWPTWPEVEATPTEAPTEAATDPEEETEPTESETSDSKDSDSFLLDCTPEQAEAIIAFYEALAERIENPPIRPFASDGDSGSVSWVWGESVNMDFPSGDPNNPYYRIYSKR